MAESKSKGHVSTTTDVPDCREAFPITKGAASNKYYFRSDISSR